MTLPGWKMRELREEVLDKFQLGELEVFLRLELNQDFARVTTAAATYEHRVFELIQWFEREGRLGRLLEKAAAERPGSEVLGRLSWQFHLLADLAEHLTALGASDRPAVLGCHTRAGPPNWRGRPDGDLETP